MCLNLKYLLKKKTNKRSVFVLIWFVFNLFVINCLTFGVWFCVKVSRKLVVIESDFEMSEDKAGQSLK